MGTLVTPLVPTVFQPCAQTASVATILTPATPTAVTELPESVRGASTTHQELSAKDVQMDFMVMPSMKKIAQVTKNS
jgi:hypothetical protein